MIIKCEVCGGEIQEVDENLMGKCPYCKTINIISRNKEKIENLFNRATFLRQNNEYKKAGEIYDEILKEDNSDAAAHWGTLLCEYGIEYIYDNKTGKKTATCHKLQNHSILNDAEYLAAIENANLEQKYIFEKEAKEINDIYERLIKISKEVKPFDIFISYKDSNDAGDRTEDSVEAQKIYDELTEKGYNVFFSRKTLETYLGKEYEPVIFSALKSSKVMILVGSSEKNINSPWVKNEWTRYLEFMEEDNKKTIIPCYFDMSPYDLPIELSKVQSLDIKKIGFIQDLNDGIEKLLNKKTEYSSTNNSAGNGPDYLYDKALTYKKLDDADAVQETFKKMTKDYPGDYRGWWGLAECKSNNFKGGFDSFSDIRFDADRAIKLCEGNEKEEIESVWKKYYDAYYEKEYNRELDELHKKKYDLENEGGKLTDKINGFKDYSGKANILQEQKNTIYGRINELRGNKSLSDQTKSADNKNMTIFAILTAINIIFWIGCAIIGNGDGIGSIILLALIVEGIIWFISWIIGGITKKAIKVNDNGKKKQISELETQLETVNSELHLVQSKMMDQRTAKERLGVVNNQIAETNVNIEELKKRGKYEYGVLTPSNTIEEQKKEKPKIKYWK